jgi:hypothetical protein
LDAESKEFNSTRVQGGYAAERAWCGFNTLLAQILKLCTHFHFITIFSGFGRNQYSHAKVTHSMRTLARKHEAIFPLSWFIVCYPR